VIAILRWSIRIGLTAALAVGALAAIATPASAHTISGPRPSNYRTRILSLTPNVPGISMKVDDLGAELEVSNHTATDLIVLGPETEPFLRVGPTGVYENLLSPATYRSRTRSGQTAVPPEAANAKPTDPPQWHKISSGQTARWHEHRAHWMGGQPPPPVMQHPDQFFHLDDWRITMLHGKTHIVVLGSLDWVPGPSGIGWWPLAIVLFAIGLLAGLWRRGLRVLALLIGILVVIDAMHAISYELGRPGSGVHQTLQFFGQNFVSIIVWVAAIAVIVGLVRGRVEALYGAVFVALMIALVGGATDLSSLWKSQLPSVGPAWLARVEVVIALALGLGVAAGALVRALRSERTAPRTEPQGWLSLLVEGLDDASVARIAADLDVDDVVGAVLADLARRARPVADALMHGSVVLVVDGARWSLVTRDGEVHAEQGVSEPVAAQIELAFPRLLQVLGGTRELDPSSVSGEESVVDQLARYLPEQTRATASRPDRAPAS
jgi:hypothetical protein